MAVADDLRDLFFVRIVTRARCVVRPVIKPNDSRRSNGMVGRSNKDRLVTGEHMCVTHVYINMAAVRLGIEYDVRYEKRTRSNSGAGVSSILLGSRCFAAVCFRRYCSTNVHTLICRPVLIRLGFNLVHFVVVRCITGYLQSLSRISNRHTNKFAYPNEIKREPSVNT